MEQHFICDLMFSLLAVALADFHTALHEPVGLRRNMEQSPQLLGREDILRAKVGCQAKVEQF